jgi:pimeloyl-ACP methyl ester carboxylesterase
MLLYLMAGLVLVYLGLCAVLFVFQRSMIYFPHGASSMNASRITLSLGDEKIRVSVRELEGPNALMYFGGNAEDVSYSLESFALAFPDHSLYLMHYRGYGGSTGSPSEAGLVGDAFKLYDHVSRRHARVTVVGRSLGSGVAMQVASSREIARLVLITPFDSLAAVAGYHYPIFPVRWLLRDRYESARYAGRVKAPTLIIAAENDEVIPLRHAEVLRSHFQDGVATMAVIPRAGHNDISEAAKFLPLLSGRPTNEQ